MDGRAVILSLCSLVLSAVLSTLHLALTDLSRGFLEELAEQRAARRRAHGSENGNGNGGANTGGGGSGGSGGGGGGGGGLRRVRKILADVEAHARAMGMARVACNLAFAVGVVWCIASVQTSWGVEATSEQAAQGGLTLADVLIGTGVAMAVLWVVSVALAESLARHAGERLVYACSPLVRLVHALLYPLKPMAAAIDRGVHRFFGRDKEARQAEFEAELMSVVEEGERGGQFDEREREMIEAVVEMKDLTVEQIMTPRTEVEALALTDNLGEVTAFVRKATHSRIPVYRESLDDIVGIFYVKDLLHWLAGARQESSGHQVARLSEPGAGARAQAPSRTDLELAATKGGVKSSSPTPGPESRATQSPRAFSLAQILRPAMFVPETKTVRETLVEMLQKKVHIAVVADEYGGTAGVISLEDIVECVFGEIQDEYEMPGDEPPRIEVKLHPAATHDGAAAAGGDDGRVHALGGTADADARAYIGDVNDALEPLGVVLPEGDEYDTLGGFVLAHLGRIPREGEEFMHDRVRVKVVEATPTRVLRVLLEVAPEQPAQQDEPVTIDKSEQANSGAGGAK